MRTTTVNLPETGLEIGDSVWLYPTRFADIPRGTYRVIEVNHDHFKVKRSWYGDLMNRLFNG